MSQPLLMREKAAFSDAVGHSMVDSLIEHAEALVSDKELLLMQEQTRGPRPMTKEAAWYRKIFDKHYPDCHSFIPGYWMPNSSWEGCRVSDPSARMLKNYGKSGLVKK